MVRFSWFFGKISRKEAERLLLSVENPRGTFLVRNSEHNPNGFSLSVKDWEEARGYHPKHYKIKPLDNGGFYIATNQTFPSLQNLVMAYSSKFHKVLGYLKQHLYRWKWKYIEAFRILMHNTNLALWGLCNSY